MRRPHPAAVALAVIAVLSLVALWDTVNRVIQNSSFSWSGEPSDEVRVAMALNTLSWVVAIPALATGAAASVLGLVLVWCLSPDRQRAIRTMSAAGSMRDLAATTAPNSSPSISDAGAAASIPTSTERE